MPEIMAQPEVDTGALAAEEAKQTAAKAALVDETAPSEGAAAAAPEIPEEVQGIYEKYQGDPVALAKAFKELQGEYTRVKQGGEPKAEEAKEEPAKEEAKAEGPSAEAVKQMLSAIRGDKPEDLQRYQATAAWASQNIEQPRIEAYNKALNEGNVQVATAMWKAIRFDHLQATGWEPKLAGGRQTAPEVKGFRSQGEVEAAMSDPRYSPRSNKFDEAYHRDVMAKLAASPGILEQRG